MIGGICVNSDATQVTLARIIKRARNYGKKKWEAAHVRDRPIGLACMDVTV